MSLTEVEPKRIVIIGGGIIGCSVAYFLTRHPNYGLKKHSITILEATEIAGGSSGKAGGFLADWATPKCLAPLSFKLHAQLAEKYRGEERWGYRKVHCAEIEYQNLESSKSVEIPQQPDWILPSKINSYKVIGTPQNSAQVHPYLLTTAILNLAKASGVNVIIGSATSLNYSNNGRSIDGVTYSEDRIAKTLAATDVILAAGPWTPNIFSAAKLKASRAHSIVIRPSRALTSHVLFVEPRNGLHKGISAEIYPRPDNTVYIGKSADYDSPLPATTGDVEVDTALTKYLRVAMGSISNEISDGELLVEQVCFKASIRDHQDGEEVGPIIGAVGVEGLWIATGHDEWGIQNAPATGLVMSEMIFDGDAKSADCRTLDPSLFLSK